MDLMARRRMMASASGKRQIVWNQLVVNGNFADGGNSPTGWGCASNFTFDNTNPSYIELGGRNYCFQLPQNPFTIGHIYYVKARGRYASTDKTGYMYFNWYSNSVYKPNNDGSWTDITLYGAAARNDATQSNYGLCRVVVGSNGCIFHVDKNVGINIFDLTMMFGAGNEPTKAEFEAMFNLPNTYYPYNAGEVMYI